MGCTFADQDKIFRTSLGIGESFGEKHSEVYSGTIEYYPWKPIGVNFGFVGLGNLYYGNTGIRPYQSAMDLNGMIGPSMIKKLSYSANLIYLKSAILGITKSNSRQALDENKKWVSYWEYGWEFGIGVTYKKITVYICRSPFDFARLELGYLWI
jgi:hypothetical protein